MDNLNLITKKHQTNTLGDFLQIPDLHSSRVARSGCPGKTEEMFQTEADYGDMTINSNI